MTLLWYLCFGFSAAVMLIFLWFSAVYLRKKPKLLISPVNVMTAGVFLSATILLIPAIHLDYAADGSVAGAIKTVLGAIYQSFSLFVIDSDFEIIGRITTLSDHIFCDVYSVYLAILFVMAPILTFGVVLSFFKNVSAYIRYFANRTKHLYVFSDLNEQAAALAKSVKKIYPKHRIAFCNVQEQQRNSELFSVAKELRAICFSKQMTSLHFQAHQKNKELRFFAIGEENKNVQDALCLMRTYQNRANSWLYVFSNQPECEVLLNARTNDVLKVRRVSEVRTLVYSLMETTGELLFREAVPMKDDTNTKQISVLSVGMGQYGTEMMRTLAWFCQMDGYRVQITGCDKDPASAEKFRTLCPELVQQGYNHQFEDDGEAQYGIDIHGGLSPDNGRFYDLLDTLDPITYVFVDMGSDEENIRVAIQIRSYFLKKHQTPRIQTIIKNSEKKDSLENIENYSGQGYEIDFVGDVNTFYTLGSIIESNLEQAALARHLKWGKEDAFWRYEYNYRSSMASALHRRMKAICGVKGVDKEPAQRTEAERLNLRKLEHRRWNAYMRSEGYTFSETRNNLAKTHHCLITYELLTPEEKAKDDD